MQKVAVALWFSCYNKVMTSDKFVYLFGRILPALSLVLSMTLRFVPKFKVQRAALAKVLLIDPDILLMDEPTKGLDAEFKQVYAELLTVERI